MRFAKARIIAATLAAISLSLSGCASMSKPPQEKLASLPVVELGRPTPAGDFVLKIPGGKAIPVKVTIDGSALVSPVKQTLSATIPHDVYVYKDWASEDGRQWRRADELFGVKLKVALPSPESPQGGEIHLTVNRKTR